MFPFSYEGDASQPGGGALREITFDPRLCDLMSRIGLAYLFLGCVPLERFIRGSTERKAHDEMEDLARALAEFVRHHQAWAAPIVMLLAFAESLAFISLLVPAWGALVAIGVPHFGHRL